MYSVSVHDVTVPDINRNQQRRGIDSEGGHHLLLLQEQAHGHMTKDTFKHTEPCELDILKYEISQKCHITPPFEKALKFITHVQ